ncbi:MAG TPA: 2-polyprenyl-3-methyl-6-methoxy-1,4-benzoquinone monooxygenase [Gammaproteobacteria bacterium]|jgi:ubiquinone biosynthesis monooxygenase Coq7|nr:2-polyprenyl-3-methyl-6-methoxy-1,4-benzoquinone monooxygenase [Gammaproteobacteria bacterium]
MMTQKAARCYSLADKICLRIDQVLRVLSDQVKTTGSPYPGDRIPETTLSAEEQRHAAALMRINHTGEVCAQGLYHGQRMVCFQPSMQAQLEQAALEEGDHLSWCKKRLDELHSRTSYLNPLWYAGSFCLGMIAGVMGDGWSLGFVAETETQVIKHLTSHVEMLPLQDKRSLAIVKQMESDESHHRQWAIEAGAKTLPDVVKRTMACVSGIMVKITYRV